MGKESKKRVDYIYIYVCTTDSLHCTPETNTTLYINYSPKKKKKITQHTNFPLIYFNPKLQLTLWCCFICFSLNN